MSDGDILNQPLVLPCGVTIPHRIVKSAMSENMANAGHLPGKNFYHLYAKWAQGGVGLCISGNVMVDVRYLGEAHNVVLEEKTPLPLFEEWTGAKKNSKMQLWMQLNHPGKQCPNFLCKFPVAPSAIPLEKKLRKFFNTPKELSEADILDIVKRFGTAAKGAQRSGFDGVQIHGAHGYLVSQFLSPKHNQRQDKWGGNLKNRMRFLIAVYRSIRESVGDHFPIGIKLNSADFQKGGFTHEESVETAKVISGLGIDLIEVSGGSYEKPVMMGEMKKSTMEREAYFSHYAQDIKKVVSCPVLLTGGFRSQKAMVNAIKNQDADMVGLARALAIDPQFTNQLLTQKDATSQVHPLTTGFEFLDKLFPLETTWYTRQLQLMGRNQSPNPHASVWSTILGILMEIGVSGLRRVRAN